jgi:predicted CopG family antitoxin
MCRLHALDDVVSELCEKKDRLMEVIERMVDELDDREIAGLVEYITNNMERPLQRLSAAVH